MAGQPGPTQDDKILGNRLKNIRVARGMSRERLGQAIGVSHQQIQKYEKGDNRISATMLAVIAKALDKPISAFFDDGDYYSGTYDENQRIILNIVRNVQKMTLAKKEAISLVVKLMAGGKNGEAN